MRREGNEVNNFRDFSTIHISKVDRDVEAATPSTARGLQRLDLGIAAPII